MKVESLKAGKELSILVRFMSHCFSKKYEPSAHAEGDSVLHDAAGRRRSFCPTRYGLSMRLPVLIRSLNHPKASVFQTARERNWLHSVTVADDQSDYHIFFELRRAASAASDGVDLNLIVESAYPQDPSRNKPAIRGAMGFILLCGKTYVGEPVATRR